MARGVPVDGAATCLRPILLVLDCGYGQEKGSSQETEEKEDAETGDRKEDCPEG
jgi:hypothetical protein